MTRSPADPPADPAQLLQAPPEKPRRKPRTAAQVAAARRNGGGSKGPVSAVGKARRARNAVRHGLLAAVDIAMPNEDPNGFRRLRCGLLADLGAADALIRLLVERFAGAFWRLARADRLEGEILAVAAGYEPRRDSPLDWSRIDLDRSTRLRARTETGFFRLVQLLLRARPTAQAVASVSPTAQAVAAANPAASSGGSCGLADPPAPPFDPRIPPECRPRRRPPGLAADLTGAIRLPEQHPLPGPDSPASRPGAASWPEPRPLGPRRARSSPQPAPAGRIKGANPTTRPRRDRRRNDRLGSSRPPPAGASDRRRKRWTARGVPGTLPAWRRVTRPLPGRGRRSADAPPDAQGGQG